MKILIAVITCEKFKDRAEAQRATWIPGIKGADVRFFLGKPDYVCGAAIGDYYFCINNKERCGGDHQYTGRDENQSILLNAPDNYEALPYKTQAMIKWALANGYDKVFKTDDDTFLYPDRLMANIPEQHYTGFLNNMPPKPWCSGFGYWLSKKAMEIVSSATIPQDEWAEDRWVGGVLHDHGIFPYYDIRYAYYKPPTWIIHDPETVIAICDCSPTGQYLPINLMKAIPNQCL
jgi:hypothetical protein